MASSFSEQLSTLSSANDLEECCSPSDLAAERITELRYSGRSPLARLTGVRILGTGAYLPETVVRNQDLTQLGCDPDWIVQRTGIRCTKWKGNRKRGVRISVGLIRNSTALGLCIAAGKCVVGPGSAGEERPRGLRRPH